LFATHANAQNQSNSDKILHTFYSKFL